MCFLLTNNHPVQFIGLLVAAIHADMYISPLLWLLNTNTNVLRQSRTHFCSTITRFKWNARRAFLYFKGLETMIIRLYTLSVRLTCSYFQADVIFARSCAGRPYTIPGIRGNMRFSIQAWTKYNNGFVYTQRDREQLL